VVFDPFVEVLVPPDRFEPDADLDSDPDAPVVAAALPSVDDSEDPDPVDSGASVMVPLAESDSEGVAEAAADSEDSEGDDVRDGASKMEINIDSTTTEKVPSYQLRSFLVSS
jgi:hypothetical protein